MKLLETPHSLEFRDHLFDLTAAAAVGADARTRYVSFSTAAASSSSALAQKEWQEQTSTFATSGLVNVKDLF